MDGLRLKDEDVNVSEFINLLHLDLSSTQHHFQQGIVLWHDIVLMQQ